MRNTNRHIHALEVTLMIFGISLIGVISITVWMMPKPPFGEPWISPYQFRAVVAIGSACIFAGICVAVVRQRYRQ